MTTSLSKNYLSEIIDDNTGLQFDDLAQSRGRTIRAASLALDKDNTFLNPGNLVQSSRRHSSHFCPALDDQHINKKIQKLTPIIVPPPIPKRTFQGGKQELKENNKDRNVYRQTTDKLIQDTNCMYPEYDIKKSIIKEDTNLCLQKPYKRSTRRKFKYKTISDNHEYQENNSDYENTIYDNEEQCCIEYKRNDKNKIISDDVVIYDISNKSLESNRSSSDSNKSQITVDTGYMSSSNENDRPIYTIGSENRVFRNRFSSEDTQSSDMSPSDYNNSSEIIDSPQSKYINDAIFGLNNSNAPTKVTMNKFATNIRLDEPTERIMKKEFVCLPETNTTRCLPAVPVRKQTSVPPKLPPPISTAVLRSRGTPPPPPLRSQTSIDSGKLLQNGHILSAFQQNSLLNKSSICSNKITENLQEMHNRPITNRKGIHGTHKPPPLTQIHHSKFNQRQDSNISSDSFSFTSSPGYNTKSMEAPLLQYASKINKNCIRHQDSNDSFGMIVRNNLNDNNNTKVNIRQDSNVSSDSFSQTSSPGYNTKLMEAPLLAHTVKLNNIRQGFRGADEILKENSMENSSSSPITKSISTPASLQTIVRIQNGSNMSLQHKILKARKNSNPYVTRGKLKFRLFQILLNAVALLAIAGGLAAYFNAYPMVKFVNKTIITPSRIISSTEDPNGRNPAPGVCLPVIVKFCQNHHLPYNFTVFPNYIGHFGQPEAQIELDAYDALVDVRCYELVSLFLCSLFVPKCGSIGTTVPPCRSLCSETMRRCGFFFDVFGLELPEYLKCGLFTESPNPDECVGLNEVRESRLRAQKPVCSGFLCDIKRCIPSDWRCDGHVDCLDQTDESQCDFCGKGSIYCGEKRCMSQKHVCDGVQDCPWGQDERNCIRLNERNGDLGRGKLEIYKADSKQWAPACVTHWDPSTSPTTVCSMLGYSSVNSSKLTMRGTNVTIAPPTKDTPAMWRMYQKKHTNLMKEFTSCPINGNYPVVELTCSNFECGKIRNRRIKPSPRIVGGSVSSPGDWPFLAAILGGPEEIFYCAGVLIADQWVLTASHCIGNHTLRNINDWTIQLGITRRHSHTYYGQKVKVKNVIPHPQYNSNVAHDNDIALFQLATRVAFHEHLLPVCLPPAQLTLKKGTLCTVIGWGKREDKTTNPNSSSTYEAAVNEVQVPVLNRDLCNEFLENLNVTEGMICAGYQEGGKDACQGDSGGPLLCRDPIDKERWFVFGIVSWGIMCAHPKLPGVYANVPKYIPWIMQQIHKFSNLNNDNNMN